MADERFNTVKKIISTGQLGSFREITGIVPKTVIAVAAGIRPARFNAILDELDLITVREVYAIAALIDIPGPSLMQVIEKDIAKRPKRKR